MAQQSAHVQVFFEAICGHLWPAKDYRSTQQGSFHTHHAMTHQPLPEKVVVPPQNW